VPPVRGASDRVERSLYERANGYNYEAVKVLSGSAPRRPHSLSCRLFIFLPTDRQMIEDTFVCFVGLQSVIKESPNHMRRHAELGEPWRKRAQESHLA
jgi:hypothetical protein